MRRPVEQLALCQRLEASCPDRLILPRLIASCHAHPASWYADLIHPQPRFRGLWERYCRGVQAIVYVVDSRDYEALEVRYCLSRTYPDSQMCYCHA